MGSWIAQHFLNPAFVMGGLALISVPIIIHLINRLRFKRVRFAAMEFLLQSQKRNRRRILIEQLLLLLLRCLAVLGLVLLISRFVLDPTELKLFQGARTHHVVLLDDSGSMRDQLGQQTAFEAAKEVVQKLVAEGARRPGTQKFTLIALSNPTQPLFTQQEVNNDFLVELDTKLDNLKPTHQSLSLLNGFEGARNMLLEDRVAVRHVHVLSDFRIKDWQDQQSLGKVVKELDAAGVTLNFVKTVDRRNSNLGITDLTGDVQIASTGVPVRLAVTIKNFSEQVASNVAITILQDGQKLPLTVNFDKIEASVEVKQEFDLSFDAPGKHRVELQLPPDSLLADNARHLALDVTSINRVLIIEGNPTHDDGDYLADALAADPGITGYAPQIETVDYLRRKPLDEFQAIYLLNVADLTADAIEPLEEFVKNGGGLCWFLGNETRPAFYLKELYRGGEGLFPVKLGLTSIATQANNESEPDTNFSDHPAFQVFQGQDNPFTELIRVFEYFSVADDWVRDDQARGDSVQTIASLTNKEPLMFSSKFGSGTVVTCLTSCGPRWNNWARYPSFVAMMLDLQKFIARPDRVLESRVVGEPIQISINPAEYLEELEVLGPESSGSKVTRLKAAQNKPAAEGGTTPAATTENSAVIKLQAIFRDTDAPGLYVARLMDQNQSPVERWLTFNAPSDEGELELATNDQVRKQLGNDLRVTIQEPGEFNWIAGRDAGQEVREWLLIVLILVLLAEQLLGYRLSFHSRPAPARA